MLHEKGLDLDAVIELKVDEGILLNRVQRRVNETLARGEQVRADDNPESLKKRLDAYRAQTAPLVRHYAEKGSLKTVDGMAEISDVTSAIGRILAENMFRTLPAAKVRAAGSVARKPASGKKVAKTASPVSVKTGEKNPTKAKSAGKSTSKGKSAPKTAAKKSGSKKAKVSARRPAKAASKRAAAAKKTASKKGRKARK
jgi:adenylate kinase